MIKLTQLELQNFLSHVNTVLPLDKYEGLVLIEGQTEDGHYSSNGSGKSTLLEGIVYALTGDTLRGVSVNDVINRNYKKNTRVSLEFSKDNSLYDVSRYRKDDKLGDSLVLYKDRENISKRVNKDTQKSLDDILGISYKVLVSTMLLGEGLSSRFTQLSDPEKKSLIESTLNLSYDISAIRAKANSKLSQLKLDKANIEGRLTTLKELSNLDIEATQLLIEENESKAAKACEELERLQSSLASMKDNRNVLDKKINLLNSTLSQYDSLIAEVSRLQQELLKNMHERDSIDTAEVPHCTVCHQSLVSSESKVAFKASYEEKIADINLKINEVHSRMSALPEKSLVETKYQALVEERQKIDIEMDQYSTMLNDIANTRWGAQSRADQLREDIKRYEESTSDIASLEKENDNLSADISKYDYFYKLFSPTGIIVNILSDAIEYINSRLSTYSSVLLEKDYCINFVKGKISLIDSKGASYQSLSNGEKRRLDISIQFALHDYVHAYCGVQMDCCFIDEILDTLDDIGVENIFDVLRLKLDYCKLKSIYVITHNDTLKNKFDRIITVKKDSHGDSYLM